MDSFGGRMALRKGQAKQPVFEDYQPTIEWSQDPEAHLLRVDLPGFKKEELKVQVDSSRKLTVKGRREEGEARFICFDKSFDVPKDSIIEKINGRFEDGCLFLIMPKRERAGEPSQEKEDSIPKEKPNAPEKKKEDSIPKEKQKVAEEKENEDDSIKNAEKHKHVEEIKKKEEDPARREARKIYEETMKKVKSSWEENIGGDNGYFGKNKEVVKRKREDKEQGWVDFGLVDDFLEKINRNRKVIAVAFVAFSIGFCVSHKLRQRG